MKLKYSNPLPSRIGMVIPEEEVLHGELYYIRENITKGETIDTSYNHHSQVRLRRDNDCLVINNTYELLSHISIEQQNINFCLEDIGENNQTIDRYINPHVRYLVEIIGETIV